MDATTVRDKLRQFIITELIRQPQLSLADDQPIVTSGLISSFSLAELGLFIETEFGIYIPDAELTVANMNTLEQITARVMRDL